MSDSKAIMLKSSAFMKELSPSVSEVILNLIFSPIGNVASISPMWQTQTKKPICYTYVNSTSVEEAKVALDSMDYDQIYGKSIRISFYYKNPLISTERKMKIITEDLDPFIASKILYDSISNFSQAPENKVSKCCEYSTFESGIDVSKILKIITELRITDFKILVSKFQALMPIEYSIIRNDKFPIKLQIQNKKESCNLYVKNFPKTYSDAQFLKLFDEYGKIEKGLVMRTENGESKGFGFICFENENAAKKAINHLHNKVYVLGEQRTLYVAFAEKKIDRMEKLKKLLENGPEINTNIYVKHLYRHINEDQLRELFKPFGEIKSLILLKKDGINTAAGLINYYKHEHAKKAIEKMNYTPLAGELLYVAFAQTKQERLQHLYNIELIKQERLYNNRMHLVSNVIKVHPGLNNCVLEVQNIIIPKNPPNPVDNESNHTTNIQENEPLSNFDNFQNNIQPIMENHSIATENKITSMTLYQKISKNPIIQMNNPNFHLYIDQVFNKVEEISPKWARKITEIILRMEAPVLEQLLSNNRKFNDEVQLYIDLLEN